MSSSFEMTSKVSQVLAAKEDAVREWLLDVGQLIMEVSDSRVPKRSGELDSSSNFVVDGDTVTIGYNEPYAVRQHEDMTLSHPNGRQAKFLESAAKDSIGTASDMLKQRLGE